MSEPLVSILVPAFNPRYFDRCLDSACSQSYRRLEIVIGDDCPTTEIERMVRRRRDPRVRYVRHAKPLGGRRNYIRLFELARGDYVKFLNDDDVLHPRCVELMAACLGAYPDVTLVTSHRQVIDAVGRPLPDTPATLRPVSEDSIIPGACLADDVLSRRINFIGEPTTVMFRRREAEEIHPHLLSFGGNPSAGNGDVSLWVSLLARGDAIYLTRSLSGFRSHGEQRQRQAEALARGRRGWRQLCRDAARAGFLKPDRPRRLTARPLRAKPWWPAPVLRELGRCENHLAHDRPAAAAEALRVAVDSTPQEPELRVMRAQLLRELGRDAEALAEFAHACELDPELTAAQVGLAAALVEDGRTEEAEALARRAVRATPGDGDARRLLAALALHHHPDLSKQVGEIHGALDLPTAGQHIDDCLRVSGWFVALAEPCTTQAALEVRVDDETVPARVVRLPRDDVSAERPDLAAADAAPGFECAIPATELSPGRHELSCVVRTAGSSRVIGQADVEIGAGAKAGPALVHS